MSPRANFTCEKCHEDYELPVSARKCPICRAKLVRLYDQVNIATGLSVSKAAEKMTQPMLEEKDRINDRRQVAVSQEREIVDRIDHALPALTQQNAFRGINAQQAIGMVDGSGRAQSRV